MSAKKSIIRVFSKSNKTIYELSHTNNVNQRIAAIQEDIKAIKGLSAGKTFKRWEKFKDVPLEDIGFEVFGSTKNGELF